jgi:hypothetical protein
MEDKLGRDRRGEIFQDELTENQSVPRPPRRDDAEQRKAYDTDIDNEEARAEAERPRERAEIVYGETDIDPRREDQPSAHRAGDDEHL